MSHDDPLRAPHLRGPGIWESVQELLRPAPKLFDVIQIEVGSVCPARCTYCPHTTRAEAWKNHFMEAATYAAAWPLMRQARRVHLQGWGEPLLHKRFFDLVELARRADCQVSTTTCGLVMNEATALALVKSGLDVVAFSLAGTSEAGNATRQGAPFTQVCAAIHTLQHLRKERLAVHLEVHIAYLLLASKLDELHALPDLLDELDVHAAVVSTMDFIPAAKMAAEAFMPWEQDKIAAARGVLQAVAARAARTGKAIYYSLPAERPGNSCLENAARSLYIAANGDMSPCIYVNLPTQGPDPQRRVYGNVNQDDPLAVWQGEEFTAFRSGLAQGTPDANCTECPKRYALGNRC